MRTLLPAVLLMIGCGTSPSPTTDADPGDDTEEEDEVVADTEVTSSEDAVADAIRAAYDEDDPLLDALEARIERELTEAQIDYLLSIDWSEHASSGLQADPVMQLLFATVADVAEAQSAAMRIAPVALRAEEDCDEERTEVLIKRHELICIFDGMRGLEIFPSNLKKPRGLASMSKVTLNPGLSLPGHDPDSSLADSARTLADCVDDGPLVDASEYLKANGCIQDDCLGTVEIERGENCGSPTSLMVHYVNSCDVPIDVNVCIERPDRDPSCFLSQDVDPSDRDQGGFTCDATGKLSMYVRHGDATCAFPDELDVAWNYGTVATGPGGDSQ